MLNMVINKQILLTIIMEEGYNSRIVGKNFDKKRIYQRVKRLDNSVTKARIPSDREYFSKGSTKIKQIILPNQTVVFFQSKESRPQKNCKEKFDWNKLSEIKRLEYNLLQFSEGKKINYSFI